MRGLRMVRGGGKKWRAKKIIPFLMNFSSEESCATRMSISPIIFLIGAHSHGIPVQATGMFRILQFDKLIELL